MINMATFNEYLTKTEIQLRGKKVRNDEWDEEQQVYMGIIQFNVQNQVQFSVMVSLRVDANAWLIALNL